MGADGRINRRGFTLLEVMVSVTIMALICAILYSGFYTISRTWRRGEENIQRSEQLRSVSELVRRQVGSIYPVTPADDVSQEQSPDQPLPTRPVSQRIPYFIGSGQQMSFVSLFSLRLNAIPGLCFVAYALEPSPTGDGQALVEYEKQYTGVNPMDRQDMEIQELPENIYHYTLLDNVESAQFEFYGLDMSAQATVPAEEIEKDWYSEWDVEQMGDLPDAVRIRYRFTAQARARMREGEIVVPIHSRGNLQRRPIPRSSGNVPG